jgi:hypothetical protein
MTMGAVSTMEINRAEMTVSYPLLRGEIARKRAILRPINRRPSIRSTRRCLPDRFPINSTGFAPVRSSAFV